LDRLKKDYRQLERDVVKQRVKEDEGKFVVIDGLSIPKRPYYDWEVIEVLPFSDLYDMYGEHKRLSVFAKKGLKCANPNCKKVATHLIVTKDHGGGRHVDVVDDEFKLMNVDHIVPKSKGGDESLDNKQPMCEYHNSLKSNQLIPY